MKLNKMFNAVQKRAPGKLLKWGLFVYLIIKTLGFMLIGSSTTGRTFIGWGVNIDKYLILAHLSFIAIIMLPAFFFKGKRQVTYLIVADILYTLLLLADLWYYRASRNFLGLRHIFFNDMFNPLNESLFNPDKIDILFIIDIPILIIIRNKAKFINSYKKNLKIAIGGLVTSVLIIYGTYYLIDVKDITKGKVSFMETQWSPFAIMHNTSPLGYHVFEAINAIEKKSMKPNEEQMKEADAWLQWNNEKLPDNKYKGMFKGKNVIFLQIESLENFVINKKIYGQEITPNLNRLLNKSLYFDDFYEQNNGGNSIDCDMMVSSGMLTLGDSITFLTHADVKYPSIERVLNNNGYETVSTHAERAGDWNWSEAHSNALGYSDMWDLMSYDASDSFGMGLSDKSFFTQYEEKLKTLKQPFFSTIPTLSSHGPFNLPEKYRKLKLPEEVDKNKLGGYFQSVHYADEQIGMLINKLEQDGLMNDTMLVIYGDHAGVHKYYNDEIQGLPIEGDWWQNYDHKIPLIIYGKDEAGKNIKGEVISKAGGQSDITPTVLYLLGIDSNNKFMGRNLLNTNRDATVIKGNLIIGNPSSEDEKKHLENAYTIADYIIKNKYFENRGLVN